MKTFWNTLGLLTFTLIFALAGCSQSSDKPDAGDGYADGDGNGNGDTIFCQDDEDCPTGQKCRSGLCEPVTACDCNYDCGDRSSGMICNRGSHECEPGTAPADQCSDNCDCYANETCSGGECVPTGGDGVECHSDDDCAADKKCLDNYCVPKNCTTREDCEHQLCLICKDGECTTPPAVCQGDQDCCVGYHCNFGTCAEDAQGCQSDADCTDPDLPRCVDEECMPECVSDVDCEGGKICIENKCVSPGCTPDQCELGEWCDPDAADGLGACVPGCDSHDDCPGQLCNYDTHQCIDDCCGGCQADQYCDTDTCTCQTKCVSDADCGTGFKCNQQTGECEPEGGGEGTPCTDDSQCAEGLLCDKCSICWPLGRTATNTCLWICSVTVPCPRPPEEQTCEIGRYENETLTYICIDN
jgi:hypothetical protein